MLTPNLRDLCRPGLKRLQHPILPLVRLAAMLYLTGPFADLEALLAELAEPVETGGVRYDNPQAMLAPYLPAMRPFERFKNPGQPSRIIVDEKMEPADQFSALDAWVSQDVLALELEEINSLLCGPCKCTLCCIGPDPAASQDFFEIPLAREEIPLFPLPLTDTPQSREAGPEDEPPLAANGTPFYQSPVSLYHWKKGWSMILPRQSSCPHLAPASGGCRIYPQRPDVCRRPQIFPYMLERNPELDREYEGRQLPGFVLRGKLLAVWDCPYVREFQEEIGVYAQLCGLEPIFKENKS